MGFCEPCARWLHPAQTLCPHCLGEPDHRPVSGRATVLTVTRNDQPWHPALRPPYIIAIVALAEDPAVRLTTNLVGEGAAALGPGSPVRIRFEQHGSVWLPLFEADADTGSAPPSVTLDPPVLPPMPAIIQPRPEDRVVISGVGASAMGRSLGRPPDRARRGCGAGRAGGCGAGAHRYRRHLLLSRIGRDARPVTRRGSRAGAGAGDQPGLA
ncbi:Zn-ribbon domain-containing OB-fold protein [Novosphingobium colocasiae]